MSEQTAKLIHIIMPDLLNYLEMVESGEIIEKRLANNTLLSQRKKEEKVKKRSESINNILDK